MRRYSRATATGSGKMTIDLRHEHEIDTAGTWWSAMGRVSRTLRLRRTVRNCTRDEGGPFEAGSQVQVSSHRELLSSRAMVVLCQEGARAPCCTRDEGGPFGAVL